MGFGRSPLPENARSKSDEQLAWVQYGHALKESENLREAEDAYRKALALEPKVADTHLQLGHALKLQGHKQAAAAARLHALTLHPMLHFAWVELVNLGWRLADIISWAIARFKRSLEPELAAARASRLESPKAANVLPSIVFEISDLIHILPTIGCQRVSSGFGSTSWQVCCTNPNPIWISRLHVCPRGGILGENYRRRCSWNWPSLRLPGEKPMPCLAWRGGRAASNGDAPRRAVFAVRAHRCDAVDAGRDDVVTATDIGEQILKQVAVAPLVRHVMLGIDNR